MTASGSRANRETLAALGPDEVMLRHTVPLRPHVRAELVLPSDLTPDEAERLAATLRALARPDRARLGQHPQVGPPWDLTADEAGRFLAAIGAPHDTFSPDWQLRPGGHCAAKGGLTTLRAFDPAEEPDSLGRRPSDINAGTVLTPELAADLCAAYNARQAETPPA